MTCSMDYNRTLKIDCFIDLYTHKDSRAGEVWTTVFLKLPAVALCLGLASYYKCKNLPFYLIWL